MTQSYLSEEMRQAIEDAGMSAQLVDSAIDEISEIGDEPKIAVNLPVHLASALIMEVQMAKTLEFDSSFDEMREELYVFLYEQIQSQLPSKAQELVALGWERVGVKFIKS